MLIVATTCTYVCSRLGLDEEGALDVLGERFAVKVFLLAFFGLVPDSADFLEQVTACHLLAKCNRCG